MAAGLQSQERLYPRRLSNMGQLLPSNTKKARVKLERLSSVLVGLNKEVTPGDWRLRLRA